jgi:L-seryl-tRNA(Ser) seleniumtransferase
MRALRVDKLTYAALDATLEEYAAGRARESIPVPRMMALTAADIAPRAEALARTLEASGFETHVIDGMSTIGGGSAPGSSLPTRLVALRHASLSPDALMEHLRRADPPVIARIGSDAILLDLRTIDPAEDEDLAKTLSQSLIPNP